MIVTKSISLFPDPYSFLSRSKNFKIKSNRNWARAVKNLYKRECFLSGQKESLMISLETHHLYSSFKNPNLRFSLLNGIVVTKELHSEFHRLYTYDTSPESFLLFIDFLDSQNRLRADCNKAVLINWIRFLNSELILINELNLQDRGGVY